MRGMETAISVDQEQQNSKLRMKGFFAAMRLSIELYVRWEASVFNHLLRHENFFMCRNGAS
jgi:hypothetical protein